jgi:hypothetical protein
LRSSAGSIVPTAAADQSGPAKVAGKSESPPQKSEFRSPNPRINDRMSK